MHAQHLVRAMSTVVAMCLMATPTFAQTTADDIVLYAADVRVVVGAWVLVSDPTAAGGQRLQHPEAGAATITPARAAPSDYFQMTFHARAGVGYHLWLRGKAHGDIATNDSVWVQFSDSVDTNGAKRYRIGVADGAEVNLEDCHPCGVQGWGWQDNAWPTGAVAPLIHFSTTGFHTIRIQPRQDGIGIDQIVLSPTTYGTNSPGALKNDTVVLPRSAPEIAIWAADVAPADLHGNWQRITSDATAAGAVAVRHPDAGAATITTPLIAPTHYFEASFEAQADVGYHVWVRGRAQNDVYTNESVWMQFVDSVTATGGPRWRIGTTDATEVNLEDCSGCTVQGWGWQDNAWPTGAAWELVYFATPGPQRVRVQTRQDGFIIDQIIFSPRAYITQRPGALKNDVVVLDSTINHRPFVDATATPSSGPAPLTVAFAAGAHDPNGTTLTYSWTFGDGGTSTQASPSHPYTLDGVYHPSVTVTDVEGGRTTARLTVNVSTQTAQQVKFVQWNIHKGREEDCGKDHHLCPSTLDRISTYLSQSGADVVSLNEVRFNHSLYNFEDQAAIIESQLETKTNQCWQRHYTDTAGGSSGTGGIALLWKSSQDACGKPPGRFATQGAPSRHQLPQASDGFRAVGAVTLLIAGRPVTFMTTHLCAPLNTPGCPSSERQTQVNDLKAWAAANFAEPRVIGGDFNANPGDSEISGSTGMTQAYIDLWPRAVAAGTATPANLNQPTHRAGWRPDYIFMSNNATGWSLLNMTIQSQYPVSDHYPILATFEFR